MEEEKDQLIKRVERLKKRVRQTVLRGPFVHLMLKRLQYSPRNQNMTLDRLSASPMDVIRI